MIRTTLRNEGVCASADQEELHSTLGDGFKVYRDLSDKHSKETGPLFHIDRTAFE